MKETVILHQNVLSTIPQLKGIVPTSNSFQYNKMTLSAKKSLQITFSPCILTYQLNEDHQDSAPLLDLEYGCANSLSG